MHYSLYTYPDSPDELNLGDLLQLPADLRLACPLKVKRLVHDGLGEHVLHVLFVFTAGHVQAVRVLCHNLSILVYLRQVKRHDSKSSGRSINCIFDTRNRLVVIVVAGLKVVVAMVEVAVVVVVVRWWWK